MRNETTREVPLLCPSTLFRIARANVPMIRMIVGRCHVSESCDAAADYVASRLKPDALAWQVEMTKRIARVVHRQNRKVYGYVMGGRLDPKIVGIAW